MNEDTFITAKELLGVFRQLVGTYTHTHVDTERVTDTFNEAGAQEGVVYS